MNGENKLSAGIASLRAELAQLLLRMEEGELQNDQFVREVRQLKFTYVRSNFTLFCVPLRRHTRGPARACEWHARISTGHSAREGSYRDGVVYR